jgi:hypothetical protein
MRVGEEWNACIDQQGVQYIGGKDPPRVGGQGEQPIRVRVRGGAAPSAAASPRPQPIRVRPAARGRQQH